MASGDVLWVREGAVQRWGTGGPPEGDGEKGSGAAPTGGAWGRLAVRWVLEKGSGLSLGMGLGLMLGLSLWTGLSLGLEFSLG